MRSYPYGGGSFQQIEQQRERCQGLVACAQDIGRADIAGADLPQIAEPGELGKDESEGDGTEQIAEPKAQETKGEQQREGLFPSLRRRHRSPSLNAGRLLSVIVDEATGNEGQQGPTLKPGCIEGRVLRF